MNDPVVRVRPMLRQHHQQPRHPRQPKRTPQVPQHATRVAMAAIEHSVANRIRNIRRDKEPIHNTLRAVRQPRPHVSLIRLRRPNAQRHLVDLMSAGGAIQGVIQLARRPDDSPAEQPRMNALPRGKLVGRLCAIVHRVPGALRRSDHFPVLFIRQGWERR